MLNLGDDYDLSDREIGETILRVVVDKLGKSKKCTCKPEDIAVRNREKYCKPYCIKCWKRQTETNKRTSSWDGRFKPIITDFERDLDAILRITHSLEDQQENRKKSNTLSLQGDLR